MMDRTLEWKRLCLSLILGIKEENVKDVDCHDDEEEDNHMNNISSSNKVINLLEVETTSRTSMESKEEEIIPHHIKRLEQSIFEMMNVLHRQETFYIRSHYHFTTNDDDSLVFEESTIVTFVASTANQLETLHQQIQQQQSTSQKLQHYSGMVQSLLQTLQVQIAQRFASWQSLRNRPSIQPQNYFIPHNNNNTTTNNTHMDDEDDPLKPPSLSTEPIPPLMKEEQQFIENFMAQNHDDDTIVIPDISTDIIFPQFKQPSPPPPPPSNKQTPNPVTRKKSILKKSTQPPSIISISNNHTHHNDGNAADNYKLQYDIMGGSRHGYFDPEEEKYELEHQETLQQERAFLQAKAQSQHLDAVTSVEQQMMQITTLLNQFSSLIQEQQEEIHIIQDQTKKSTQQVQKGHEELVTNVERRNRAKHYMAKFILLFSFILLFINYISP